MTMNTGPTLQRIYEAIAAMEVMVPDEPRVVVFLFPEDVPGIEAWIRAEFGDQIKVQRHPHVPPGQAYVLNNRLLQGPLERYSHDAPPVFEPEDPNIAYWEPPSTRDILLAERERLLAPPARLTDVGLA